MTDPHAKLLDAAAQVYSEFGFRGATTRRIADEAGVNEITIFRHFGSKEALINEAIRTHVNRPELPVLPEVPAVPAAELTTWCRAMRAHFSDARSLIRRMMSETDERPVVAPCLGDGPRYATECLRGYVARLEEHGFLTPVNGATRAGGMNAAPTGVALKMGRRQGRSAEVDPNVSAAVSMLMSALFADAMGREMMPDMYPLPAEGATAAYVWVFLRALGVRDGATTGDARVAPPRTL